MHERAQRLSKFHSYPSSYAYLCYRKFPVVAWYTRPHEYTKQWDNSEDATTYDGEVGGFGPSMPIAESGSCFFSFPSTPILPHELPGSAHSLRRVGPVTQARGNSNDDRRYPWTAMKVAKTYYGKEELGRMIMDCLRILLVVTNEIYLLLLMTRERVRFSNWIVI